MVWKKKWPPDEHGQKMEAHPENFEAHPHDSICHIVGCTPMMPKNTYYSLPISIQHGLHPININ